MQTVQADCTGASAGFFLTTCCCLGGEALSAISAWKYARVERRSHIKLKMVPFAIYALEMANSSQGNFCYTKIKPSAVFSYSLWYFCHK